MIPLFGKNLSFTVLGPQIWVTWFFSGQKTMEYVNKVKKKKRGEMKNVYCGKRR